jgi:hypothetical protein
MQVVVCGRYNIIISDIRYIFNKDTHDQYRFSDVNTEIGAAGAHHLV